MTRKHYEKIAQVLKAEWDNTGGKENMFFYVAICTNLAVAMKQDNPNFSTDKFLEACGAI
jgi:hypothetical protein